MIYFDSTVLGIAQTLDFIHQLGGNVHVKRIEVDRAVFEDLLGKNFPKMGYGPPLEFVDGLKTPRIIIHDPPSVFRTTE